MVFRDIELTWSQANQIWDRIDPTARGYVYIEQLASFLIKELSFALHINRDLYTLQ